MTTTIDANSESSSLREGTETTYRVGEFQFTNALYALEAWEHLVLEDGADVSVYQSGVQAPVLVSMTLDADVDDIWAGSCTEEFEAAVQAAWEAQGWNGERVFRDVPDTLRGLVAHRDSLRETTQDSMFRLHCAQLNEEDAFERAMAAGVKPAPGTADTVLAASQELQAAMTQLAAFRLSPHPKSDDLCLAFHEYEECERLMLTSHNSMAQAEAAGVDTDPRDHAQVQAAERHLAQLLTDNNGPEDPLWRRHATPIPRETNSHHARQTP